MLASLVAPLCHADPASTGTAPSFYAGPIKVTLSGFVELIALDRNRNEADDWASNFNTGIPFPNSHNYDLSEFRFTERQSRIAALAEGPANATYATEAYVETDFGGASTNGNNNQSSSFSPRVRHFYADLRNLQQGWYFLFGQTWSLLTAEKSGMLPRNEDIPLTIDGQYVPGFDWLRIPQIRFVKSFGSTLSFGLSAENPAAQVSANTTAPAASNLDNNVYYTTAGAGNAYAPTTNITTDYLPDVLAKVALDPGWGHYEVFGLARWFRSRYTLTGAENNQTTHGYGIGGNTVNAMILGGLALAFSRLIDNSVVVLENIFRHLELGASPAVAAEVGGNEVALPVLAATLTTAIVFFPVIFLYGVSRFLFTALALAVVLALFASYFVAMTVVPLFCAKWIKAPAVHGTGTNHDVPHETVVSPAVPPAMATPAKPPSAGQRFNLWFNLRFNKMLDRYEARLGRALLRPAATVLGITGLFLFSLSLYPLVGKSYFPRTDPGQFVINLKAPAGTRLEISDRLVARVEQVVRQTVPREDLEILVSNIGTTPGFSSMYTSNSGPHTAFVQVGLRDDHSLSSFEYMDRVRQRLHEQLPELSAYLQTGGLVDAVLNLGLPAPLDVQVSGSNVEAAHAVAAAIAKQARALPGVSDVLVPQDVDYPSLRLDINRIRASELGLSEKEVVGNVITALTSNQMIAPSFWVDPKSGNDYLLTVQYPEDFIRNFADLSGVPLRGTHSDRATQLDTVSTLRHVRTPTEVDHYQLRREMDVYVAPAAEDLSAVVGDVQSIIRDMKLPDGVHVTIRGSAQAMQASFSAFGFGLILATLLVYLVLVAQFKSFKDPLLILLAVPTGLTGVLLILFLSDTTLNVMSLMGVVMMVGIVVSNSILIVDFANRLRQEGHRLLEAISHACRVRLRPVLMTSLATLMGLIPMAMKLGTGSEAYAPLARAIIGGLAVSVVLTVFIVPAAYYLMHRKDDAATRTAQPTT